MKDIVNKAEKIIEGYTGNAGYCVLALIDFDGNPTASTISVSKAKGISEIYFCTGLASNKSKRIKYDNRASVCFSSGDYNITLVGEISVETDHDIKLEMWYEGLENHFSGPHDHNYCVLKFKTHRYSLFIDWNEVTGTINQEGEN